MPWKLGRELWSLAARLETGIPTRFSRWCGAVARNVLGGPETASNARSRPHPNSWTRPAAELQTHYFMAVVTAACTSSALRCLPQMFGPRICWLFFTILKQQAGRRLAAAIHVISCVHPCCYYTPVRGLDGTTCEIVEIAGMVERTKATFASIDSLVLLNPSLRPSFARWFAEPLIPNMAGCGPPLGSCARSSHRAKQNSRVDNDNFLRTS